MRPADEPERGGGSWRPEELHEEWERIRGDYADSSGAVSARNWSNFWFGGFGASVIFSAVGWLTLFETPIPKSSPDYLGPGAEWTMFVTYAAVSLIATWFFARPRVVLTGATVTVVNPVWTHTFTGIGNDLSFDGRNFFGHPYLALRTDSRSVRVPVVGLEQSLYNDLSGGSEGLGIVLRELEHRRGIPTTQAESTTAEYHRSLTGIGVPFWLQAAYWSGFLAYAWVSLHRQ